MLKQDCWARHIFAIISSSFTWKSDEKESGRRGKCIDFFLFLLSYERWPYEFQFWKEKKLLQYRICLIIYSLYNPALSFSTGKGISFAGILSYTEELNIWCQLWLLIRRLKIFVPITLLAFTVLVPVHWTNSTLRKSGFTYSDVDKLSISNVPLGSQRLDTFSFLSVWLNRLIITKFLFFYLLIWYSIFLVLGFKPVAFYVYTLKYAHFVSV